MTKTVFTKPFTQQEAIPDAGIEQAVEVLRSGRLHRYNTSDGETSEVALLEQEYAAYMGQRYCLACTSGGYSMHTWKRQAITLISQCCDSTLFIGQWFELKLPGSIREIIVMQYGANILPIQIKLICWLGLGTSTWRQQYISPFNFVRRSASRTDFLEVVNRLRR